MFRLDDAARRRMLEDALVEYLLDPQAAPAVRWTGTFPASGRPAGQRGPAARGVGQAT